MQTVNEETKFEPQAPAIKRNNFRIIFYALMEAASRYREGFWREDVEAYRESVLKDLYLYANAQAIAGKPVDKGYFKRADKKAAAMTLEFEQKQKMFTKTIDDAVESLTENLTDKSKAAFDNYATAFGLIAEELAEAKNTTEMITLCKLYNMGVLGSVLEDVNNEIAADRAKDAEKMDDESKNNVGGPVAEQVVKEGGTIE